MTAGAEKGEKKGGPTKGQHGAAGHFSDLAFAKRKEEGGFDFNANGRKEEKTDSPSRRKKGGKRTCNPHFRTKKKGRVRSGTFNPKARHSKGGGMGNPTFSHRGGEKGRKGTLVWRFRIPHHSAGKREKATLGFGGGGCGGGGGGGVVGFLGGKYVLLFFLR